MKKTSLQIIIAILIWTFCFNTAVMAQEITAVADEIKPAETVEGKDITEPITYTLTLEQAIEMAMDGNAQLEANSFNRVANEINIKSAHLSKSATKDALKKAGQYGVMSATTMEELCSKKGYYVKAAQLQYDLSVMEEARIRASISYNVTNAYYNAVLTDMLVTAAGNAYELALDNKAVVDAQYAQGLVPEMSYANADIAVDAAKSHLEAYELNKDIALHNLKNIIGAEPNSILVLTDNIETKEYTSDVEADIAAALTTRYDINAAQMQMNLAYEYFDLAGAFTDRSAVYNTAYADYINKQYQYNTAKDGITLAIRSEYNSIITNYSAMSIAERTCNMKQKEYDAAKLQYELGMITNIELTDKINALYQSRVDLAGAKLTYRMSVEKYKYDITVGI